MFRPDAKNIPTSPDQELLALLTGIPRGWQTSPRHEREVSLSDYGSRAAGLTLYNCVYAPGRGPAIQQGLRNEPESGFPA